MAERILVLGGARSGKSRFAQQRAESRWPHPVYVATAEVGDAEMAARVKAHQQVRSDRWRTLEAPLEAPAAIRGGEGEADGFLMDCVTIWLSNVLLKEGESKVMGRQQELVAAFETAPRPVILVSNEVGMSLVPEYPLGRLFRDLAGRLNQDLAAVADTVVLVVAGLPWVLKGTL